MCDYRQYEQFTCRHCRKPFRKRPHEVKCPTAVKKGDKFEACGRKTGTVYAKIPHDCQKKEKKETREDK